jgi:hypothetical protein
MKLPGGDNANVPDRKLREYLLSETHPVGKSKARFWRSNGFGDHNIESLREALMAIARSGEVDAVVLSPYGVKYLVKGMLYTRWHGCTGADRLDRGARGNHPPACHGVSRLAKWR